VSRPSALELLRDSEASLRRPRSKLAQALAALDVTGDRTEVRILRRLQFAMALASIAMISGLGGLYAYGEHWNAAALCGLYVGLTVLLIAGVAVTGRFAILRIPHVLIVAALPLTVHAELGGYVSSGGALIWTLIVPIAATMFGFQRAWLWGVAAMVVMVIGYFVHPAASGLSPNETKVHFAFNLAGFAGFVAGSLRYFVVRIEEEKAKSDRLLHQVLPAPIVRRLKRGQVIADHIPGVTVVFADIVGFTPLAAKLAPAELVALLDEIFTRFDELAAKYGVEKIKTIGDAYMAVAGAPEPCADHAPRAARLAIAMRDHVVALATERNIQLAIRVGLHSGEVVAGVIGIERFAYDLWGDTVNTASRMESHGQPGEIQLTGATRTALGDSFTTRERGAIEVKGRGTITTYWLDG
jgi:adenylate cyclase